MVFLGQMTYSSPHMRDMLGKKVKFVIISAVLCLSAANAYAAESKLLVDRLGDGQLDTGFYVYGLKVVPIVELTLKHDSNITRAETNPISSYIGIFKPVLDITAGTEINFLNFNYAFERGEYTSSKNDSYTDHFIKLTKHNEPSSRTMYEVTAKYSKSHDARGTTFSGIVTGFDSPDKWHETAARAKFSYGSKKATGRIVLDGGYAAKRYDNHRTLTAARDMDNSEIGAIFYYGAGERLSALVEARYETFDYKLTGSLLNSKEITLYTGFAWEATGKTTGTIKVGWQGKNMKLNSVPSASYLSWDASIKWEPLTYSTWMLKTGFRSEESDGTGSFTKVMDVNLDWNHQWSKRLSQTIKTTFRRDTFVGSLRRDKYRAAGISFNYDMASWLGIGAGYSYSKRDSNAANAGYTQSIITLALIGAL